MITHIVIKNFLLIRFFSGSFSAGLTTISGESGSGKSTLLKAIQLLMGERFDTKHNESLSAPIELSATFDLSEKHAIAAQITEHGVMLEEGQLIVKRTIKPSGKGILTLNDVPCTLKLIKQLRPLLVDMHLQQQNGLLTQAHHQRALLDKFHGNVALIGDVDKHYQQLIYLNKQLVFAQEKQSLAKEQGVLLEYQLKDLSEVDPKEGEWEHINKEYDRLSNVDAIQSLLVQAGDLVAGKQGISVLATQLNNDLSPHFELLSDGKNLKTLLEELCINASEIQHSLFDESQLHQSDDDSLKQLSDRINKLHTLSKKLQQDPSQLASLYQTLLSEQQESDHEMEIAEIKNAVIEQESVYLSCARALSKVRTQAAEQLSLQTTEQLQPLNMEGSALRFTVTSSPEKQDKYGIDQVALLLKANMGYDAKPLEHCASGGEVSRVNLVLNAIFADREQKTFVFDEIDTGVSGATAQRIAQHLKKIAHNNQVLCITHLPQVVSASDQNYYVRKHIEDQRHVTTITLSDPQSVTEQIQQMVQLHQEEDNVQCKIG
jgi:DNA repair protein RecN (Recombination protein N)